MVESTKEKDQTVGDKKADESTIEEIKEDIGEDGGSTERFVEIEDDVRQSESSVLPDGEIVRATVVDAERISSNDVPEGYPGEVDTERCLKLSTNLQDNKTSDVYINWSDDNSLDSESHIGKILQLHDLEETEIADLQGKEVLLEVDNGYYKPNIPSQVKGTSSVNSLLASLGLTYGLIVAGASLPLVSLSISTILFTIGTLVVVPYFTYQDSWHRRSRSDWNGGPLFWTTMSFLPIINIISTLVYTTSRRKSKFI